MKIALFFRFYHIIRIRSMPLVCRHDEEHYKVVGLPLLPHYEEDGAKDGSGEDQIGSGQPGSHGLGQ